MRITYNYSSASAEEEDEDPHFAKDSYADTEQRYLEAFTYMLSIADNLQVPVGASLGTVSTQALQTLYWKRFR